jgi:FlaA1/EpsC-like NDP-sugar epimerase
VSPKNFTDPILSLPRWTKRVIVLGVDAAGCVFTVWFAYFLRVGEFITLSGNAFLVVIVTVAIALPIFILTGLYRTIFRYSGWPALLAVARSIGIYGLVYAAIFTAIGVQEVPRTIGIIQPILLLLYVGASRTVARLWLGDNYQRILKRASRSRVLVYGAGSTGRQLVAAITNSQEMRVVGFLDDDDRLHGNVLNGQPVYASNGLSPLVTALGVDIVLLAMPGLKRKRRNEILGLLREARVAVRVLPSVTDLAAGKMNISDLRELDIDDLLGREPVMPDHSLLAKHTRNKIVMVTGAGGSIGSELCRQIMAVGVSQLLLVEQSEYGLYRIHQELQKTFFGSHDALVPLLASVQDKDRMADIMATWLPSTIYHAAAYKHVPLVEHNPSEGIKNNVIGTFRMARLAIENGVSDFVLISTDKAVRPTNVMGASKRLSEMVLQALSDTDSRTKFSMVRFGNVLGSSGSVVPKFRQQIREGGPITLTHPEITRYFMSIPEAAQLVIQAGAMSNGGDVFVLDMGDPVQVIDLARKMIELSGFTVRDAESPNGDIEIEITGLRPGEKLYEELIIGNNAQPTTHPRIMRAREAFLNWSDLEPKLNAIEMALNVNDVRAVRSMLTDLVIGYVPEADIVDWVYLKQEV